MDSASTSSKAPRVLIGRGGADRPFRLLADGLRREGYQVDELASSPVGAHSTGTATQDVLGKIDMAFLIVRESDAKDNGGPVRPFQRVVREAGVIQGQLGMDRVVLLVEETVEGLSADTGIATIRFPAGMPEAVLNDVLSSIRFAFPPRVRDLRAQPPIMEQARSDALKLPWLLVAAVCLLAFIPFVLAIRAMGADSADDPDLSIQQLDGLAGALTAGAQSNGLDSAVPGDGEALAPQAPSLPFGGDDALLPVTCRLDLSSGRLSDETIECDGAGGLAIEGFSGPWHTEIGQVAVSPGVVGELVYEPRSDGLTPGTNTVELLPGTVTLDQSDATFGVDNVVLQFSAQDQHIHLLQADSRGGEAVTLIFSLGL